MSFLQPWMLWALPLIALPILIHLINQWRYQTRRWGAMMFLLAANRMNRGFARVRQWLILAMRTLALAALFVAVARPLASGLLGWAGNGKVDTTLVLVDRSPSMQQREAGGMSKLKTARGQLDDALGTIDSQYWVAIDSTTLQAVVHGSRASLLDSPALSPSTATTDLPAMLQGALEYLKANNPGSTDVWIVTDLRESDWNADSGTWNLVREGFEKLPQTVRFHLLTYSQENAANLNIVVTDARRSAAADSDGKENDLLLSFRIARPAAEKSAEVAQQIPVEIEIEGARSTLNVELKGNQAEVRNHSIRLANGQVRGWGRVSIPADGNLADNESFFVFDQPPQRRVVIVSEDRLATRALEIASGITEEGGDNSAVEVLAPGQLDSLALDETALLLWQTTLPDATLRPAIEHYVKAGGQVIFFPPTSLVAGNAAIGTSSIADEFMGVGWKNWVTNGDAPVMVEGWRSDQDLLAATASGMGLPVGQLKLNGYAKLHVDGEISRLATLTGGDALLARVPTDRGGVYFWTASAAPDASTLAENGVVLFVAIQRTIQNGQAELGNITLRTAAFTNEPTADWRQLAGDSDVLSSEYAWQAGVYGTDTRMFAVSRSAAEDQTDGLSFERIEGLFGDLPLSRVDQQAGSLAGLVREVWRFFLVAMIVALTAEAALCLPKLRSS